MTAQENTQKTLENKRKVDEIPQKSTTNPQKTRKKIL
jgi:hypothetical protein